MLPGCDLDAVWRRGLDVRRHHQHRRHGVAQERRTEPERQQRNHRHRGQRRRVATQRLLLHASGCVHPHAGFDRLFDDAPDERRRFRHVPALTRLDRAQQRRLERRLVLFEVERHLLVGHAASQRNEEEPVGRGRHHHEHRDACGDDRCPAEPGPLHAVGGEQEQPERDGRDRYRAAQRQLHAPARTDLRDDLEKACRGRRAAEVIKHESLVD